MNMQLSVEAWVALGCLAGVVLLSGGVLWAAWRRGKGTRKHTPPAEKVERPGIHFRWEKEDAQFAELARKVDALRALRALRAQRQEQPGERNPKG